jgi:hypothetical protein
VTTARLAARAARLEAAMSAALPVLDSERRPVVLLVVSEVVLRGVGQKAGCDHERDVGPLRLRPGQKPLESLRRDRALIVFAVHEPRFGVSRAVDVDMIYLGGDITATVCRTARFRGSFPPVNVVKARKALQQLEAELLEFRFVKVCEVHLMHDAECRSGCAPSRSQPRGSVRQSRTSSRDDRATEIQRVPEVRVPSARPLHRRHALDPAASGITASISPHTLRHVLFTWFP